MENEKTQSNKKGKIAVLVAMVLLLIAILCMGGVTFSKYVTKSSDVSKQATVAKWGYVITVNANDMFSSDYTYSEGYARPVEEKGVAVSADAAVEGGVRNLLVAPGTTGSLSFSVAGQAEVLAKISITVKDGYQDVTLAYTEEETAKTYNPIKWTLKKGETTLVNGLTLKECVDELKKADGAYIDAGTQVNDSYTLSWVWAFSTDDATDALDTMLGNVVAGQTVEGVTVADTKTTISLELSIGVEQVQEKEAA